MKLSRLLPATTVLVLALSAATSNAADTTSHRQQVETLFRLTQMENKINESVESVVQLQIRQNPQLAQYQKTVWEFFTKHSGWAALKNDIADMYISTFTEKELADINAFYITPVGQKVIKLVPELVAQRNQLAMARLQQNISELQDIISAKQPAQVTP